MTEEIYYDEREENIYFNILAYILTNGMRRAWEKCRANDLKCFTLKHVLLRFLEI